MSSQEIGEMQNFDSVLKGAEAAALPFYKKWWFAAGTGIAVIATIIVSVSALNNTKPNTPATTEPVPVNSMPVTVNQNTEKTAVTEETAFSTFWVESGNMKTYAIDNDLELIIPASNFVDEENNEVNGKIEIRYRETNITNNSIVEAQQSSDLSRKQAGVYYEPKSNKYFEVLCFKNNKKVFTSTHKPIIIQRREDNNKKTPETLVYAVNSLSTSSVEVTDEVTKTQLSKTDTKKTNKKKDKPVYTTNKNIINTRTDNTLVIGDNAVTIKDKKPSFNISYPVDPNDPLNKALENITVEIEQLKIQAPVPPLKMDADKQNFTLKFDSELHPELDYLNETILGVADESQFTPALYKYKWEIATISKKTANPNSDSNTFRDSYIIQLKKATYIGEELFYTDIKTTATRKPWYKRLWDDIKSIFTKTKVEDAQETKAPVESKPKKVKYTDGAIRLVPVDSSQYYYQRSDYRSPVSFEVIPVLSDEQYAIAIEEYKEKLLLYNKLLEEKQQKEKEIREAIKKRREERISSHRRKIEIYMGLSKDTGLQ